MACELALTPSVGLREEMDELEYFATSEQVMTLLIQHHGFRPGPEEARKAALLGSVRLLRLMLQSVPASDMQLSGMQIFTRAHPGLKLLRNEESKACMRVLLTRGAKLGSPKFIPKSKLLFKIDADSFPLWARRCTSYFRSHVG